MSKRDKILQIGAWCLYDWGIAPFSIMVITFIFAAYFTSAVAINKIEGTYQWANATALAGIIIAIASPIVGSIADHGGHHKRWLFSLTAICIAATALLYFVYPTPSSVPLALACLVVGTVAYEVGLVFYNAFLPHIAPKAYVGRISGWGWSAGYLGGIVALSIALVWFVDNRMGWFDTKTAEQIRACGPFAAVWILLFVLPMFMMVRDIPTRRASMHHAVRDGWRELIATLKKLPQEKNILLYLISHMIYTDGLNTLFAFGGIYAAGTYGMTFQEVMLFGITMNVAAGIGALVLAWADDYFGSKETVLFSLVGLTLFGIPILFLHDKYTFWVIALLVCLFVGPVQSASRSLMVHLTHKSLSAEMFGLYALSGRITAFIGPWILGALTLMFDSQRIGMATVIVFFIIGGLLLLPVKVVKSHLE